MEERYTTFRENKHMVRSILKHKSIMILLMAICSIRAVIELDAAYSMQTHLENGMAMHPEGGLSPLCQYAMRKNMFIQNLRRYLFTIDSYNIKDEKFGSTIYDDIDNNYLQVFTQQLINMFPSEDRYLSIESEKSDSFTRFLREHKDKSDGLYVLASLFLLSEGINIPIEIVKDKENKNKILVLKKKKVEELEKKEDSNSESEEKRVKMKEGFHVNLSMNMMGREEEDNTAEPVYQKKTEEIVNFFKSLVNTDPSYRLDVPEEFLMPTTHEEFLTGNFLCNPKFLIQSYIFEYINSVEMYKKFVRAVYELITEKISDEKKSENPSMETKNKAQEVFNTLFISGASCELPSKMKIFNELYKFESKWNTTQENMPLIENFYFNNLNRDGSEKSKDQIDSISRIKYKNHTVNMLLGMICCFSFDPITKEYTTKSLLNPSTELKDFLRKYRYPTDLIDGSAYLDWCKVIGNLHTTKKADGTLTKFNPNAKLGIINLLYGIEALVGTPSNFKSRIFHLENAVESLIGKDPSRIETESLCVNLKTCIEEIFQSFKTKNHISVFCNKYQILPIYQNTYDLVPFVANRLSITYFLNISNTSNNYIEFNLSIDNYDEFKIDYNKTDREYAGAAPVEQDLWGMKKMASSSTRYIDWVVSQYLYIKQNKLAYSKGKNSKYEDVISRVLNDKPRSPNSLLLYGSLDSKAFKSKIVELFLIQANERNGVVFDNNMIKFTRNLANEASSIVDSENSPSIWLYIYNENYEKYYPRNAGYIEEECDYAKYLSIVKKQLDSMSSSGNSLITSHLVALYKSLHACNNKYLFFGSFYIFAIIINELSISGKETETIQNTKGIINEMQICNPRKFNISTICLSWFIRISCWYEDIPLAFTKVIYGYIQPEDSMENIKLFFISDFIDSALNKTVHFMTKNKDKLLIADDKDARSTESIERKYKMVLEFVEGLLSCSARNNLSSVHLDERIEK